MLLIDEIEKYPEHKLVFKDLNEKKALLKTAERTLPVIQLLQEAKRYKFKGLKNKELNTLQDALFMIEQKDISDEELEITIDHLEEIDEVMTIEEIKNRCRELGWEPLI